MLIWRHMISKSFGNINNKCTGKTKLKHSTTYRNGSIQRFSFTSIQTMYWKVSPEWNRFFNWHFTVNGHNGNTLNNIATEYLRSINKPKSNGQNSTKNIKNIKLQWVPILGLKLRKEFKKKNIKTVFTSGANLKSILCQDKSKLIPNSYPGVYTLNSSCNAEDIGEAKKKVMTKTIEHQQDSIKGKWESPGATELCLKRHGQFNWLHQKTLSREARYKSRKIRESLEIKRSKCDSSKSNINCNGGNLMKTNTMAFIQFSLIKEKKPGRPEHLLTPQALPPIISYFWPTPHPHSHSLKVDVICASPLIWKEKVTKFSNFIRITLLFVK